MKLYIIRHGETSWNAEGRLQGQTDIPLNENGIRLAKITGEALKEVPFIQSVKAGKTDSGPGVGGQAGPGA